jgi:hypothetical protein
MTNLTVPLLIIGAALPRTGTTSIAGALERLGYKVFHATTISRPFLDVWDDICRADAELGNESKEYGEAFDKFVRLLSDEGFNATLDQPSCFVYERLMRYYPDAKVLQTLRDPDEWARSMVEMAYSLDLYVWQPPFNHHWNITQGPYGYWSKKQLGFRDDEIHPGGVVAVADSDGGTNSRNSNNKTNARRDSILERGSSVSLASCREAYLRYSARVSRVVPPGKLVRYHPREGWEPLCRHFVSTRRRPATDGGGRDAAGMACPSGPFPRSNSQSDGFLLDFRRNASARVHLHRVHPSLARQEWLVGLAVRGMKVRRHILRVLSWWLSLGRWKQRIMNGDARTNLATRTAA